MQNLAKREWMPQITLKEANEVAINWVIRARQKNILKDADPQLFYTYVLEQTPPLNFFQNIGQLFKYSQKDTPYIDHARINVLKLLAASIKAHFFLFNEEKVSYEPYFFSFPSLENIEYPIIGMIYKIQDNDKCIVSCSSDISLLFQKNKILFEFPVIVGHDSYKWYHIKNWAKLRELTHIDDKMNKPWLIKKERLDALNCNTIEELTKYGTPLDVPKELKDLMKPTGIVWHNNTKKWFLPKGYDVDVVNEYLNCIKKNNPYPNP